MEDERKDYLKALSRQCKRETLFCDMDDYTVNLFSSEDTYPSHFHTFEMDGFTVRIENCKFRSNWALIPLGADRTFRSYLSIFPV